MIQILKYIGVFFLGCLFIAHNPDLNKKVINLSEIIKNQVISLTGKVERNEMDRLKAEEARANQKEIENKKKE